MRRTRAHVLFVFFYALFFGLILPAHDHTWLRIDNDGDADAALAAFATPGDHKPSVPPRDDCAHCAFCQFAARLSHSPALPGLVLSLQPLNYLFISSPPAYVPADVQRMSDARAPPIA
ncbi:MAG TPA: hypothetical protein VG722_07190 [Tepidisphaeraceae bacterium]|nr:hypothetical protein [Tepidisphaeraceae bacterium]